MSDLNGTTRSRVKEFIKGHSVFHPAISMVRRSRDFKYELRAINNFRQETKIQRVGKVKVGFLAQCLPVWNKVEAIYEEMDNNPRFEVYIICVPNDLESSSTQNEVYQYFLSTGYRNVINAKENDSSWLDLKSIGLEYIFCTRPYNNYMPNEYSSHEMSRYSKICGIQYGCPLPAYNFVNTGINKDFCRDAYYFFAGNDEECKINIDRFKLSHRLGLQKTVNDGWPFLATFAESREKHSEAWSFSENDVKVMWTPRWTTNESVGGTNFIRYYRQFVKYIGEHSSLDFVIRPHPMMFDNFLKTGEMSREEIEYFKNAIKALSNAFLDEATSYESTLWESSFLVSDYSSVVVQYFTTDKPIIYCITEHSKLEYTSMFQNILSVNYVAYGFDDIERYIHQLSKGDDPKKQDRISLRKELFGENFADSPRKIVQEIYSDSQRRRQG